MRRPPLLSGPLTVRRILERTPLADRPLLTLDEFVAEAALRDRWVERSRSGFEAMDRVGVLSPLAFARIGNGKWFSADPYPVDHLVLREEIGFRPWAEIPEVGDPPIVPLYSPWQLLYVAPTRRYQWLDLDFDTALEGEVAISAALDRSRGSLLPFDNVRRTFDLEWRPTILALMRLQARYWPLIGRYSEPLEDPTSDGYVSALAVERERHTIDAVEADLGADPPAVRAVYEYLAWRGRSLDPEPNAYELRRLAPRPHQEQAVGYQRQALDCYDAAQTLRCYLAERTGELEPDVDQLAHRDGVEPRPLRRDRAQLMHALRRHGLYPHRLHLIVEGETEMRVIEAVFLAITGTSLTDAGIEITSLGGDKLKGAHVMLDGFAIYANEVALLLDKENDVEQIVKELRSRGIVAADNVRLMDPSFEEENFAIPELIEMVRTIGVERHATLTLTPEAVEETMVAERRKPQPRGLAGVIRALARRPENGAVEFSKSTDLADEISGFLIAELQSDPGWYEPGHVADRFPILRWMWEYPVRTAWSSPRPPGWE